MPIGSLRFCQIPASHFKRRMPVVEGIFYSDNAEELRGKLFSWGLEEALDVSSLGGKIIIAPHGAWDISGEVAAAAFASLQKLQKDEKSEEKNETVLRAVKSNALSGIQRVFILAPCHGCGELGVYLSESMSFQTPFGDLSVDRRVNRRLTSCSTLIKENDILHLCEHSIEVLLPMIKFCFPDAKIVPILTQGCKPVLVSALSNALREISENYLEKSLLIVSSNVSTSYDMDKALSMADEFSAALSGQQAHGFSDSFSSGKISACGGAIITALFESGLLDGKRFQPLTPLMSKIEEDGRVVCYGSFLA